MNKFSSLIMLSIFMNVFCAHNAQADIQRLEERQNAALAKLDSEQQQILHRIDAKIKQAQAAGQPTDRLLAKRQLVQNRIDAKRKDLQSRVDAQKSKRRQQAVNH